MLSKKQLEDAAVCDVKNCNNCTVAPLCDDMYKPNIEIQQLAKTALVYRELLERTREYLADTAKYLHNYFGVFGLVREIDNALNASDNAKQP